MPRKEPQPWDYIESKRRKKRPVNFRCTDEQKEFLENLVAQEDISLQRLVERALEMLIRAKYKKKFPIED
jgi:predicted HicB family RNase H-like nuclease